MKKTMTQENAVSAIQHGSLSSLEMTTELVTNASEKWVTFAWPLTARMTRTNREE